MSPRCIFEHRDQALEWCENRLLAAALGPRDLTKFSLAELDIFTGPAARRAEAPRGRRPPAGLRGRRRRSSARATPARLFFVVARGTVTVQLRIRTADGERIVRVASLGPGVSFGEMALLDGGRRSADIVADERVVCYGFSVEQLREIGSTHPNLIATILANMMRDFSERLRRANDEDPRAGAVRRAARATDASAAKMLCRLISGRWSPLRQWRGRSAAADSRDGNRTATSPRSCGTIC